MAALEITGGWLAACGALCAIWVGALCAHLLRARPEDGLLDEETEP